MASEVRAAQARLKRASEFTEIAHWFADDPEACVRNRRGRRILRSYEHPYRYWYKLLPERARKKVVDLYLRKGGLHKVVKVDPRKLLDLQQFETVENPLVERQGIPFWDDLREQLVKLKLPQGLENRFADYLTGYLLVVDLQQKQSGSAWRALKRSSALRALFEGASPASTTITTTPPHKEHLRTKITVVMAGDLAKRGWSQKRAIYSRFVIPVWEIIGVRGGDVESLLRQRRRSHHKDKA